MAKTVLINYTGRRGGGPLDAIEMTKGLLKQDCEIIAILSQDIENKKEWELLKLKELIFVPTYQTKFQFVFSTIRFWINGRRKLKKRLRGYKIDIIYCPMITFWTKMINDCFTDCKVIVVNHDPLPHSGDKYAKWMKLLSTESVYLDADRIVVHTQKFVPYVEDRYNKRGQVIYIPLGRHDCYKKTSNEGIYQYDPQKTNYIFFGTFSKYKGIDILLEAYQSICKDRDDVSLSIYGSGDFSPYQNLANRVSNLTVVNKWISDEDVANIFAGENLIMVLPYIDATQSGVVLVAMDFGVPIIATDVGGLAEQIENNVTGILVEPGDSKQLADAMRMLADDKGKRRLINKNVSAFLENIGWDVSAKKLVEYMDEL